MKSLAERLKQARDAAKLSQAALAKRIGAGQSTIASIENGRNKGTGQLVLIARELGVRPQWLADGELPVRDGDMESPPPRLAATKAPAWPFPSIPEERIRALDPDDLKRLEGAIALAVAQLKLKMDVAPPPPTAKSTPRALVAIDDIVAANDPDYIALPLKRVKIRAGVAGFSLDQTGNGTAGAVYVPRSWLVKRGINPELAFASYVGGMSMWPRVQEGDVVVVNPGDTERRNGIVYAFNHDGEFTLKRLKRQHGNRWYLTSDNPNKTQFPPVHADEGTFMIGRAVLLQAEEI